MIDKQYGKLIFICDECDESLETDTKLFAEADALRKEEGWIATKSRSGNWTHTCPMCVT